MENTLALLGAVVLLTALVSWVNGRHDRRKAAVGETPDDRVTAVWDDFGLGDDPESTRLTVDALLDEVDPSGLRSKNAVVSLAVMAARAERYDALPAIAKQARGLDDGCGETAAIAVLAEAYTGDVGRARAMFHASRQAMAGCASCGAKGPGKYLMEEVALALDALEPAPRG